MAPLPLEGNQTPMGNGMQEGSTKVGSISLGLLIDFIVQRTYHDLTVLAELLPRKSDTERKIEIYNFSSTARQLFVRLLALVKWASSASKVDKSTQIMAFLDKQSMIFIETADMLSRLSRETVVRARLQNFQIPAAVEVLTTGTYSRIPSIVKDRIVPSEPITTAELRGTLHKLNKVIEHRLVSSGLLPQMRNLTIENGRVIFHVDKEFEVSLTVMGDDRKMPWKLLGIDILVEDRETGEGKPLVHPLQVQYLQDILQPRILECADPLKEVYSCLHFFCQSLQLEVFFSQTFKLCKDRLEGHINIDDYVPGKCLSVSYWRELTAKDSKSELGYTITLLVDVNKPFQPLSVIHIPSLGYQELEIAEEITKSEQLSMERLLIRSIHVRITDRLREVKRKLSRLIKGIRYTLRGTPATLSMSLLLPCLKAEQLFVTIDTHTGMIKCHIPEYDYIPTMQDLQNALNADYANVPALISDLRFWLAKKRCEKTLQHLPVSVGDHLPLIYPPAHRMSQIGKRRMHVTFNKCDDFVLIVEIEEKDLGLDMKYKYHLLRVKKCTADDIPNEAVAANESDTSKFYLRALSMINLSKFLITHGSFTEIIDTVASVHRERYENGEPFAKKRNPPAYCVSQLAHVTALCEQIIAFAALSHELTNRGIPHNGLDVECDATSLVLRILSLPAPASVDEESPAWNSLLNRTLSIAVRPSFKDTHRNFIVEFIMYGSPVMGSREQGSRRCFYYQYDISSHIPASYTVDILLKDWARIVHLYAVVDDFQACSSEADMACIPVCIKSYNYQKAVMAYGPDKQAVVTVQWSGSTWKNGTFSLHFGCVGTGTNPHSLVREQLEYVLNNLRSLVCLVNVLHATYLPLWSISKLPSIARVFPPGNKSLGPFLTFVVIAQAPHIYRIIYHGLFCLEVSIQSDECVQIRDAAYSRFDRSTAVFEYTPTPGLKTFLSKYEDPSVVLRRRSQSEDDNPPSPIRSDPSIDSPGGGFLSGHRMGGPQSPAQRDGLRFYPPVTPPSNPHTPSSPHTGGVNPQQVGPHQPFGSSPASNAFGMSSPPTSNITPSPSILPHPSPGASGLLAHSPSNPLHVPSPAGACNSPATWPGSPGIPRPSPARPGQSPGGHSHSPDHRSGVSQISRGSLPQKSWAGAIPTTLSYEALDVICTPTKHPNTHMARPDEHMSPLERFLGCVLLKRHLLKSIQQDDCFNLIPSVEAGVIHFKVESLQCRVCINPVHDQALIMKISTFTDTKESWTMDELQVLENFFNTRVAAPPYKPQAVTSFLKILACSPYTALKDFIQIMRLDLMPVLVQQQQMKWSVQWCLQVPPSTTPIVATGSAAFLVCKGKLLFFLSVTKTGPFVQGMELPSLILPVVYDTTNNITQLAEKKDGQEARTSPSFLSIASAHVKRFADYNMQNNAECSIFPVIRDFLLNFSLTDPSAPMVGSPAMASPMMNVGQMQGSPMMAAHSPMMGSGPPQGGQPGNMMNAPGQPSYHPLGQHNPMIH